MTISARSRKLLWGRSGSRCAICRRELIMAETPVDDESIVGDECHIVSAVSGGPRYDPSFPQKRVHDYSNLLLLCKIHHKLIDDQELEYTAIRLSKLKAMHERWVDEQLDSSASHTRPLRTRQLPENTPKFLGRICSGKELLNIVTNAFAFAPHYDSLRNETEEELVSNFLENTKDWGELGLESMRDRMHAARCLDKEIKELEQAGFWVFGVREKQILEGGSSPEIEWPVAHVQVLRNTNPEIIRLDDSVKQSKKDVK